MILTTQQAKALIDKPKNASNIKTAQDLALRASLHCERYISSNQGNDSFQVFFSWVESFIIDESKKNNFKSFFRYPSETVNNVEEILDEFKNIFNAQDRIVKHTLNTEDLESDFLEYNGLLKINEFIKNDVFKSYFCSPNDFIIYDLPQEVTGDKPQPYPVLISVFDIVDFYNSTKYKTEYLIIKKHDKYICIDDEKYLVFFLDEDGEFITIENENGQQVEALELYHELGFIPAQIIGKENLIETGPHRSNQIKTSRLHKILSALDELLFKKVSKFDSDLYTLYPILSGYKQRCDYTHPSTGARCKDGFVEFSEQDFNALGVEGMQPHREKCPKCSKNTLRGPGAFITVPAPDTKEDADLKEPITRLSGDVVSLEWIHKDVSFKANDIFLTAVGESNIDNSKQYNELKIAGSYESKKNILKTISRDFEYIENYTYKALAGLRYFDGQYQGSFVSYGNEFFTLAFEDAHNKYKEANKDGIEWLKPILANEIIMSKYDNNKEMREREKLKQKLNPFYFKTPSQVQAFSGSIPQELFLKGSLFDYFIDRFELKFGPIEKILFDSTIEARVALIDKEIDLLITKYIQNDAREI